MTTKPNPASEPVANAAGPVPGAPDQRSAVHKAMALLCAFGDDAYRGVGVSELARRAELSKSTAHRLLSDLTLSGAVERAGNAYRIGRAFREIGTRPSSTAEMRLRDLLTPFLADLFVQSKQTVHLAVLNGTDVVYLNKLYGHLPVRSPSRIGGRAPAHCTGVGKVLLAHEPKTVDALLASPLTAWTPETITDPARFRAEMAEIHDRGIAFDREEILVGLHCIAAPVLGPSGHPIAALSISGPVGSFVPEEYEAVLRRVCFAASQSLARIASKSAGA